LILTLQSDHSKKKDIKFLAMSGKIVIIPTYNEKENIENILRYVMGLQGNFHVLVIEDNSPDGTAAIVKKLIKEFPDRLFIEERKGKLGLGTAYIHGFRWALKRNYEYIFEMDADFSHNPDDLLRLYEACKGGADVAIGSRYVGEVIRVVNWPMGRVMMSYFASKYVRLITGLKISDSTAGFICYRRKVLETIWLDRVKFIGYAFQIEMKLTASKLGFKVVEIPIVFTDRTVGLSKMSKGIFKEAVIGVIKLRFKKIRPFPHAG
jgi:dolichol-phosphate mannosyltransferase